MQLKIYLIYKFTFSIDFWLLDNLDISWSIPIKYHFFGIISHKRKEFSVVVKSGSVYIGYKIW